MENCQKPKKKIILQGIDFIPAVLQKGNSGEWRVVFYATNPNKKNKLERVRKRIKPIKNTKTRTILANKIVFEINQKLLNGWNPFVENENVNAFKTYKEVANAYLEGLNKMLKDKVIRYDTKRTYTSCLNNINAFMEKTNQTDMFIIGYTKKFIIDYLDYIYYDRGNSPTTRNNNLQFLHTFGAYLVERGFISSNPASGIKKLPEIEKVREVIPDDIKEKIKDHLMINDPRFLILCMTIYTCLIRRTELTKLKVKDVLFNHSIILIPKDASKSNKKDDWVTMPDEFAEALFKHTENSSPEMYLFSNDSFKPGYDQLEPKKITTAWNRMQRVIGFDKKYQLYSLKDTGITQMVKDGYMLLSVKNQARHSDIKMTERYMQRKPDVDPDIKKKGISF